MLEYKESSKMVNILHGQMLQQEFWKNQLLAFFSLIFINDLSDNLLSNPKLFADDTFLFSAVQDITLSTKNLNYDLKIRKTGISVENEF